MYATAMKLLHLLLCITYVHCFYTRFIMEVIGVAFLVWTMYVTQLFWSFFATKFVMFRHEKLDFWKKDIHPSSREKIIKGASAIIGDATYQATLEYMKKLLCGAAIIAENWLLTAEKCFLDLEDIQRNVKARTGTIFKQYGGQLIDISNVYKYSSDTAASNVNTNAALVQLAEAIKLSKFQKPIPIENSHGDPAVNSRMTISGFGKKFDSTSKMSPFLNLAELKVLPRDKCRINFNTYIPAYNLFCAESYPNDTCHGDLGGPGVIDGKLVAVITGKLNCGISSFPGVYTKVGAIYNWIRTKTGLPL